MEVVIICFCLLLYMTYQMMNFFFLTWDLMNFINFMPLIILIKSIILIFSNLATKLSFDQWCICDDFETSANQICCDEYFIRFFFFFGKDSSRIFSFQLMQKVACFFFRRWHHTLNQHIHNSDTMHPSSVTHFNIMILISLCENCILCTFDTTCYEFPYFSLSSIPIFSLYLNF